MPYITATLVRPFRVIIVILLFDIYLEISMHLFCVVLEAIILPIATLKYTCILVVLLGYITVTALLR